MVDGYRRRGRARGRAGNQGARFVSRSGRAFRFGRGRNGSRSTAGRSNFGGWRGRGARGRGGGWRSRHSDRGLTLPPASFTRSSIGRERESITMMFPLTLENTATLEQVQDAWIKDTDTTSTSVYSIFFNASSVAKNVSVDPAVAVASKRTIMRLNRVMVRGESTVMKLILAGGKQIYNANGAYTKLDRAMTVRSNPLRSGKTGMLELPTKADMVNQKGYKLVNMEVPGFENMELQYAFVGYVLVARSMPFTSIPPADTELSGQLSIEATLESVPNPGYEQSDDIISPPDLVISKVSDPSVMLRGYNDDPTLSQLRFEMPSTIVLFPISATFLARGSLDSLVPKPSQGVVYKLDNPIAFAKSTSGSTTAGSFRFAIYNENTLDTPPTTPRLYYYEYKEDAETANGTNTGTVSAVTLSVPVTLKLTPFHPLPIVQLTNLQGRNYTDERVLVCEHRTLKQERRAREKEDEESDTSSIITISGRDEGDGLRLERLATGLGKLKIARLAKRN